MADFGPKSGRAMARPAGELRPPHHLSSKDVRHQWIAEAPAPLECLLCFLLLLDSALAGVSFSRRSTRRGGCRQNSPYCRVRNCRFNLNLGSRRLRLASIGGAARQMGSKLRARLTK